MRLVINALQVVHKQPVLTGGFDFFNQISEIKLG